MKTQLLVLGLALIGFLTPARPVLAAPAIAVTDAWTRATPGSATSSAVYFDVTSVAADRLVAVRSPIAGAASLHIHKMEGDVMIMRPVDGVDLVAGQTFHFAPRGYHVMLSGLKAPLKAGDHFPLTLTFAKAGPIVAEVEVRSLRGHVTPPAAQSMQAMPGMDMGMTK